MDFLFNVIKFIKKVIDWFSELSLKGKVILIIIIVAPILWLKIPDPKSVEITPILGKSIQSTITYKAEVSQVEISASLVSTLFSELSSLSKYSDAIGLINTTSSLIDQNEKLKKTSRNFKIPIGAGQDSFAGYNYYTWKKTYRRFFTKDTPENTLVNYNLIIINGDSFFHFRGSRNAYFAISLDVYAGTLNFN